MNKTRAVEGFVCIVVLVAVLFVGVWQIKPAYATPTQITYYPYIISSAGSYQVSGINSSSTANLITISASNIYLDGQNYQLTGSGSNVGVWAPYAYSNVTIVNMNLTTMNYGMYFGDTSGSSLVDIENCTIDGAANSAVKLNNGCNNCTVRNCIATNSGIYSFLMDNGGHNILFDNLTSIDSTYFSYTIDFDCYNVTIQNCNSTNSGGVGYISDGENYNFTIRDSTSKNDAKGFEIENVVNNGDRVIQNCSAVGCDGGLELDSAQGNTISNCSFSMNASGVGVWATNGVNNTVITRCIFSNGANAILDYTGSGVKSTNVTYSLNNFVSQTSNPIYMSGSTDNNVLHNAYSGNSSANHFDTNTGLTLNDSSLGLTMSKIGDGTISPVEGLHYVNGGNWSQTFTATPGAGYSLIAFILNGVTVATSSPTTQAIITDSNMTVYFNFLGDLPKADQYVIRNGANYDQIRGSDNTTVNTSTNFTYLANLAIANLTTGQTVVFNGEISQDGMISASVVNVTLNYYQATVTLTRSIIQCSLDANNITVTNGHWIGYGGGGSGNCAIRVAAAYCVINGTNMENYITGSVIFANWASSYLTVQNCVIHDCQNATSASTACNLQQNNANEGHNNFINDHFYNMGGGLMVAYDNGHNLVSGVEFDHLSGLTYYGVSGAHGIYFDGGSGSVGQNNVTGCSFHDFTGGGGLQIKCQYNKVWNNTFTDFASGSVPFSIYSQYSGATANDNDIYDNTYTNCWFAIMIGNGACNSPTLRNKIHDSIFINVTYCIALDATDPSTQACNDTQVFHNTFTSCTNIFPTSPSSPSLIVNTVIRDNDFNAISVGSWVTTCTNTSIYNNTAMADYKMLNMSVVGNGVTVPDGLGWQYYTGTTASVIWPPTGGNSRVDFSIDGVNQTTTESPINITMSADHVGIAYFTGTPPPVVVTITLPTNTTCTITNVPVEILASGGTIGTILWNCTFTNGTVAYANTVYTVPTSMTLEDGAYIFNAYANNTLGEWDEETVMFTVLIVYPDCGSWWGDWWGLPS